MSRTPYGDVTKKRKRKSRHRKKDASEEIEDWRHYYKDKIIEFIQSELVCPPDVPPHPDLGRVPDFVMLSNDQIEFILYLVEDQETAKRFILAAGRGAGKTFCIALYVAWRLCCCNDFTMTVMGGSSEQSLKIKEYIDFWRDRNEKIFYALYRSIAGGNQSPRVWSRWNSYARFPACYTPDTEILTKDGMKYFPEINYDDEIATLNPDTHEIEYHKPYDIISFKYEGDMFSWSGKSYNLICTLDQNLYVKRNRRKNSKFELIKAEEILNTSHEKSGATKYHIKRNCNWNGFSLTDEIVSNEIGFKIITEYYLELMGWYLSEGWFDSKELHNNKNRVGICQSDASSPKRQNQARIKWLLKRLNIKYWFDNERGFTFKHKLLHKYFSQFGKSYEKYIPSIILNSSKKDMDRFLKTFIFGDGTLRNGKIETIITSSKKMKDNFIELLLKSGYGITCRIKSGEEYEGYKCKENYVLQISHKQLEPRSWIPPEKIHMKTMVWDVSVPNHIIYVGRKGKYSWQGNCSETSARGPHVTQLFIDEVCVGEAKSIGSAKAVRSARYQLTSSSDSLLGLTSTAQYILGTFFYTWTQAEKLGYKKFRWSIARHKSAMWYKPRTKEPNWNYIDEILYKDTNPDNWTSNVWWITEEDIYDFRINSSNDEFLVEVLGGMSRGSGLVFSRDDLRECICTGRKWTEDSKECEECEPYTDKCPMIGKLKLKLSMISERRAGADFGEIAPNALTITGKRGNIVFVLYSDELTGEGTEEVLEWIVNYCDQYNVWEIFADPEERAMRQALENRELSTPNIWAAAGGGRAKNTYVNNTKRYVERHWLIIPKKFGYLVDSVSALAFDSKGNVRKHNDHSFDSLWMSMADYDVDEDISGGFYKGIDDRKIGEIWKN